jgi:hypothetical protein
MARIWDTDPGFLLIVLQAIEREHGALDDREKQDDLLRKLIQNHKSKKTRALAIDDISVLRKKLGQLAKGHPATTKIVKVSGRIPWLQNLFHMGTKAAIDPEYLDMMQVVSSNGDEAITGGSDDRETESDRESSTQPETNPQPRVSELQRDDATLHRAPSSYGAAATQVTQSYRTSSPTTINESSPPTAHSMRRGISPEIGADSDVSKRVSSIDRPNATHNMDAATDIPESTGTSAVDLERSAAAVVMGGEKDNSEPNEQRPVPGMKIHAGQAPSKSTATHSNMNAKVIHISSEDEDKPEPKSTPKQDGNFSAVRVKALTLNAPKKVSKVPPPNRKRKFAIRSESDAYSPDSDSDVEVGPEPEPKAKKTTSDSKKQIGRVTPATKQRGPANTKSTTDTPKTMSAGMYTAQPRGPVDVTTPKDGNWVSSNMEKIADDLFNAVVSFCQTIKVEQQGASNLVPSPPPELDKLYTAMFGDEDWAAKLTDIEGGNDSVELRQVHTLFGLFGAGINSMVFLGKLPWDLATRLETALESDREMANKVFVEQYHDSFDGFVKRLKEQQILDPKFQQDKVAPHARKLARELILVLRPHLQRLQKGAVVENPLPYKHWKQYLETAFRTAITVKTIQSVSPHGPFSVQRPVIGTALDLAKHKPYYELGNKAPLKVLHCVLPAVLRRMEGKYVPWARAVVIPYTAK